MGLSATVVKLTPSDAMEALQVVGLTSLACIVFACTIYGELLLLKRV